jgi:hypothetical protein
MPDWTNVVSAGVGVAGFAYGLIERYAGKRSLRINKINEVLRDREDKVLFSPSVDDEELVQLAASAKEWRQKCSEAKAVTSQGSPARHHLKVCLDAAALFENQVQQMIREQKSDAGSFIFAYGADKKRLDEFKARLREVTEKPAEHLAAPRHWWNL